MPNLSTLTVTLSANSAKLVAAFNQTQRRAKSWSQRMVGVLKFAGTAFLRLGTLAAAALSAMTVGGVKAGDQLAKTAAKLGVLPDALSGLRFAAEQTGVDVRKLDLGLQRMVRRVAEAAQGTGEAQGALKELGIEAKDLVRLSPDRQFEEIAEAMSKIPNQADRVRLGFKLFESEGVALINTLKVGKEGLRDFTEEAARLGLALGPQQLRNIQAAADAQNRLGRAFAGLGRQLAAAFAPAIRSGADAVTSLVTRVTESIPKLSAMATAILGVGRAINSLTQRELEAEFEALSEEINRLFVESVRRKKELDRIGIGNENYAALSGLLDVVEHKLGKLRERSSEVQAQMRKLRLEADTAASGQGFVAQARASLEPTQKLLAEANTELELAIANFDRLSARGQSIFESTRTPMENFISRMREARELNRQGLLPGGEDTLNRLRTQQLDGLIESVEDVSEQGKEKLNDLSQFGIQAARNIQTAFADRLRNATTESFGDIAKSFADMIKDMAAQIAANKILTAFFGQFTGNQGFLGEISRGFLDRRAAGGPFSGARPVLVGERGPELLFPNGRPGFVAPNSALGGSTVVVNIQNAPAPARTRERNVGGTRIVDVIFEPILSDLAQNGPLAQAFAGHFGLNKAFASR